MVPRECVRLLALLALCFGALRARAFSLRDVRSLHPNQATDHNGQSLVEFGAGVSSSLGVAKCSASGATLRITLLVMQEYTPAKWFGKSWNPAIPGCGKDYKSCVRKVFDKAWSVMKHQFPGVTVSVKDVVTIPKSKLDAPDGTNLRELARKVRQNLSSYTSSSADGYILFAQNGSPSGHTRGQVCSSPKGVAAITQQHYKYTWDLLAHELAHLLGALHTEDVGCTGRKGTPFESSSDTQVTMCSSNVDRMCGVIKKCGGVEKSGTKQLVERAKEANTGAQAREVLQQVRKQTDEAQKALKQSKDPSAKQKALNKLVALRQAEAKAQTTEQQSKPKSKAEAVVQKVELAERTVRTAVEDEEWKLARTAAQHADRELNKATLALQGNKDASLNKRLNVVQDQLEDAEEAVQKHEVEGKAARAQQKKEQGGKGLNKADVQRVEAKENPASGAARRELEKGDGGDGKTNAAKLKRKAGDSPQDIREQKAEKERMLTQQRKAKDPAARAQRKAQALAGSVKRAEKLEAKKETVLRKENKAALRQAKKSDKSGDGMAGTRDDKDGEGDGGDGMAGTRTRDDKDGEGDGGDGDGDEEDEREVEKEMKDPQPAKAKLKGKKNPQRKQHKKQSQGMTIIMSNKNSVIKGEKVTRGATKAHRAAVNTELQRAKAELKDAETREHKAQYSEAKQQVQQARVTLQTTHKRIQDLLPSASPQQRLQLEGQLKNVEQLQRQEQSKLRAIQAKEKAEHELQKAQQVLTQAKAQRGKGQLEGSLERARECHKVAEQALKQIKELVAQVQNDEEKEALQERADTAQRVKTESEELEKALQDAEDKEKEHNTEEEDKDEEEEGGKGGKGGKGEGEEREDGSGEGDGDEEEVKGEKKDEAEVKQELDDAKQDMDDAKKNEQQNPKKALQKCKNCVVKCKKCLADAKASAKDAAAKVKAKLEQEAQNAAKLLQQAKEKKKQLEQQNKDKDDNKNKDENKDVKKDVKKDVDVKKDNDNDKKDKKDEDGGVVQPVSENVEEYLKVLKSGAPLVAAFGSQHCSLCRETEPSLAAAAKTEKGIRFFKLPTRGDFWKIRDAAVAKFPKGANPGSIPYVVAMKDGQVVAARNGRQSADEVRAIAAKVK